MQSRAVIALLSLWLASLLANSQSIDYSLNEPLDLSLAKGTNTFSMRLPENINSSNTLQLETRLVSEENIGSQHVTMVALYDKRALNWKLSGKDPTASTSSAAVTLCFEVTPKAKTFTIIGTSYNLLYFREMINESCIFFCFYSRICH